MLTSDDSGACTISIIVFVLPVVVDCLPKAMAGSVESYVNHMVSIITADGRNFVGTLKGFDQTVNVILDDTHERIFSTEQGVEQVVLGLHIIRGDNIAVIGELDEELDKRLDLKNLRAEPIVSIVH